jgi:hypothetical protein
MRPDLFVRSGLLISTKGAGMHNKQIEKILGYVVIAVVGYFIVKALFPYLILSVVGLLGLRLLNQRK